MHASGVNQGADARSDNRSRHPLKMVAVHLGAGKTKDSTKSLEFAKMICEEVMLQHQQQQEDSRKRDDYQQQQPMENFDSCPECKRQSFSSSSSANTNQITAETAVVQLIQRMEDNQDLNCALGSNLNIQGQVECDAGFMSDRTRTWCGVGAISGCRNPISLVKSMHDHQNISRPLGLVQPNLLVGSGAKQWMREHCPHLNVADSRLISSKAFSKYQKLKSSYDSIVRTAKEEEGHRRIQQQRQYDLPPPPPPPTRSTTQFYVHPDRSTSTDRPQSATAPVNSSASLDHGSYCMSTNHSVRRGGGEGSEKGVDQVDSSRVSGGNTTESDGDEEDFETLNFDTVGAIAVDCDNNFVSAVSSGGLLLKYKGRLGQAAIPGAGCWSEDNVAATTTGVGEYLTTSQFAKKFFDKIQMLRMLYDFNWFELTDPDWMITGCIEETFDYLMDQTILSHVPKADRLAGILAVTSLISKKKPPRPEDRQQDLYLSYGHNTETMCIGYMTSNDVAGHSIMSRQELGKNIDEPLVRTITLSFD